MKSILLIGMGKFGQTLGERLLAMGDQVMIVDKREEIVNQLAGTYTDAVIANCMNKQTLAELDVPSFDVCIVAIGDDFQSSLEITSLLKDFGAKVVYSKASTEIQRKFLLRNGADHVIFPDSDVADSVAVKINSANVHEYFEMDKNHCIVEIEVPTKWQDKSIVSINPRAKFGMNILMVKKGDQVLPSPTADYVFQKGDHVVVFGKIEQILAYTNKTHK